jgi:hypothetical protein
MTAEITNMANRTCPFIYLLLVKSPDGFEGKRKATLMKKIISFGQGSIEKAILSVNWIMIEKSDWRAL